MTYKARCEGRRLRNSEVPKRHRRTVKPGLDALPDAVDELCSRFPPRRKRNLTIAVVLDPDGFYYCTRVIEVRSYYDLHIDARGACIIALDEKRLDTFRRTGLDLDLSKTIASMRQQYALMDDEQKGRAKHKCLTERYAPHIEAIIALGGPLDPRWLRA